MTKAQSGDGYDFDQIDVQAYADDPQLFVSRPYDDPSLVPIRVTFGDYLVINSTVGPIFDKEIVNN